MIETTDIRVLTDDEMLAVAGGAPNPGIDGAIGVGRELAAQALIEGVVNTVKWFWPF